MKQLIRHSILAVLLVFVSTTITSCKKKFEKQPSQFVTGTYIGYGEDINGNPFLSKQIVIEEVSKDVIRVVPTGINGLSTFEIEIMGVSEDQFAGEDGNTSIAFTNDGAQNVLSLAKDNISFGGFKQ